MGESFEPRQTALVLDHDQESRGFGFEVGDSLAGGAGRTGMISTPHGVIETPAFVVVGTKATVKTVLPETVASLGAQAVLANAYHLYLQPGADIVEAGGGLGRFMNWPGPTYTDSGGFQVMSLGVGFKKVLAMDDAGMADDDVVAAGKSRLAHVDDDGVTFTSHLDGSPHRFTPEVSMQVQHQLGRRRDLRLRRADHADEHPRLPGAVGRAYARLGRPLPGRASTADPGAGGPAVPGAVRGGAGCPVRGSAPPGCPRAG